MFKKIVNFFKKIPEFFFDVRKEMKKVTWPTRNETVNKTLIVITIFIMFALILGGLDAFFTMIIRTFVIKY